MHRALSGGAPWPLPLWLAEQMDVFPGRLISEILEEVERLPVGLLAEVLEARRYRQMKAAWDGSDQSNAVKARLASPLLDVVIENELALAHEEIYGRG